MGFKFFQVQKYSRNEAVFWGYLIGTEEDAKKFHIKITLGDLAEDVCTLL